jgi:hypothetical protein
MKKPELVLTKGQETISGALGISDKRRAAIQKQIETICKEEQESDEGDHSTAIKRVWDAFEDPQECAFAMYILIHEENEVAMHSFFKLPENVGEEVEEN